ncbi:MAG TPA: hypothetical protein VKB58_09175 [Terriglobales bacterium]|jgi:hypothetical protein|nr:hypothetical protein [Terriglobales bacterium]
MKKAILTAVSALIVITLTACGSSSPTPPPPPTVTVTPATLNLQEGSSQQFMSAVTNTNQTAVTWQVNGVTGGNATVGTISSTGLYTAPAIIPNPASVTVTAVLQANSAFAGNAIVTITAVQFNNSSIKGNYVLSVQGINSNGFAFYLVGTIVADGNGNITMGEEDVNDVSNGYSTFTSLNGNYSVGADGRGVLNLNVLINSGNTTFTYAFALKALNNAGLVETDLNVINGVGDLEQQASGPVPPVGNFAFGFAGSSGACLFFNSAINSNGIFNLTNGSVLAGTQDVNCGGRVTTAQSISGSYSTLDVLGRGTGAFAGGTGRSNFTYYVVSPNRFRFISSDVNTFFLGSADMQTQQSFASADFAGNYVVSTAANLNNGAIPGVSFTLIQFAASAGNISTGHYDVNNSGVVGQASLTGAYGLSSNGRISGTFNVNGVGLPFAMYLVSPAQGYYLDERTSAAGGGNVYGQSANVTSNADWAGSYATKQFGYIVVTGGTILPVNSTGISGQISADGNGVLAGTLDINDPPPLNVLTGQTLQGTYSVGNAAPGRMTVSITTPTDGTRNYVGYIVDQTRVVLMENDAMLTAGGDAIRQF